MIFNLVGAVMALAAIPGGMYSLAIGDQKVAVALFLCSGWVLYRATRSR